ncbi:unnamed protein product [marine sediment metagenome]|uniref:Uncharacterized protein n=1 Tax=marine sediment metagenome TaxID=412755 RepID=X0RU89_9ZZZZ
MVNCFALCDVYLDGERWPKRLWHRAAHDKAFCEGIKGGKKEFIDVVREQIRGFAAWELQKLDKAGKVEVRKIVYHIYDRVGGLDYSEIEF